MTSLVHFFFTAEQDSGKRFNLLRKVSSFDFVSSFVPGVLLSSDDQFLCQGVTNGRLELFNLIQVYISQEVEDSITSNAIFLEDRQHAYFNVPGRVLLQTESANEAFNS
jgi:hypothetical protein